MKILLVGKNAKDIEGLVKSLDFEVVNFGPEVIISYGGDGTLLYAERIHPGIPKLPIRDGSVCKKCSTHDEKTLLEALLAGKLQLKEYRKLETTLFYKTFTALNDFVIRNTIPIHTIRFKVTSETSHPELAARGEPRFQRVSGSIYNHLLIGDGIVFSTAFGSTGYFKSITGQSFESSRQKWSLAFNNTTEKVPPVYPNEDEQIRFKLVRGQATLSFDNNPDIFKIDEVSELVFKLSDQIAKIYEPESLRCPDCKVTR